MAAKVMGGSWREAVDGASGRTYTYNRATGERQWADGTRRPGMTLEQPRPAADGLAAGLLAELRQPLRRALADAAAPAIEAARPRNSDLAPAHTLPPGPQGAGGEEVPGLAVEAAASLAKSDGPDALSFPRLTGWLLVAAADGPDDADPPPTGDRGWRQAWIKLEGGKVSGLPKPKLAGSPAGRKAAAGGWLQLGPEWRVAPVDETSVGPLRLWQSVGVGAAEPVSYFLVAPGSDSGGGSTAGWQTGLQTSILANVRTAAASLRPASMLLELSALPAARQLAADPALASAPYWATALKLAKYSSAQQLLLELCVAAAADANGSDADPVAAAATLWEAAEADAEVVAARVALLVAPGVGGAAEREAVATGQAGLVAALEAELGTELEWDLIGQVVTPRVGAALQLLAPLLARAGWVAVRPHAGQLVELVREAGLPGEPGKAGAAADATALHAGLMEAVGAVEAAVASLDVSAVVIVGLEDPQDLTDDPLWARVLPTALMAVRAALASISPAELSAGATAARQQLHEMAAAAGELVELGGSGLSSVAADGAAVAVLQEHASHVGEELAAAAVEAGCRAARLSKLVQLPEVAGGGGGGGLDRAAGMEHQLDGLLAAVLAAVLAAAQEFANRLPQACAEAAAEAPQAGQDDGSAADRRPAAVAAMAAAELACGAAAERLTEVGATTIARWACAAATDAAVEAVEQLLESDGRLSAAMARAFPSPPSSDEAMRLGSLHQYLLAGFEADPGGGQWELRAAPRNVLRRHVAASLAPELAAFQAAVAAECAVVTAAATDDDVDEEEDGKEWQPAVSSDGRVFFHNPETGEVQWEDARPWPPALEARFEQVGPLGFTVVQRREVATGQHWMEVSVVKPAGQAAVAGVEVGLMLHKVQGHVVVGLGRNEVEGLVAALRPLEVVFVKRDSDDFAELDDETTDESPSEQESSEDEEEEAEAVGSEDEQGVVGTGGAGGDSSSSSDEGIEPTSSFAIARAQSVASSLSKIVTSTSPGRVASKSSPARSPPVGSPTTRTPTLTMPVLPAPTPPPAPPPAPAPAPAPAPRPPPAKQSKPSKPKKSSMFGCCGSKPALPAPAPTTIPRLNNPVPVPPPTPPPALAPVPVQLPTPVPTTAERRPVSPVRKRQQNPALASPARSPAPAPALSTAEASRSAALTREVRRVLSLLEAAFKAQPPLGPTALEAQLSGARKCRSNAPAVDAACRRLERRLTELCAEDDRLVSLLAKAAHDATPATIPRMQQLLKTYRGRVAHGGGGERSQVSAAYCALRDRLQQLCVQEEERRHLVAATRAVRRALWDTDHESMRRIVQGYQPMAAKRGADGEWGVDGAAAERGRLRLELEKLALTANELRQKEEEDLAVLASTRQLESAASSSNLTEMREALEDHRPPVGGFDDPRQMEVYSALQRKVKLVARQEQETARRRQQAEVDQQKKQLKQFHEQKRQHQTLQDVLTGRDQAVMLRAISECSTSSDPAVLSMVEQLRKRVKLLGREEREADRKEARRLRIVKLREDLTRAAPGRAAKPPEDITGPAAVLERGGSKGKSKDAQFHERFEWKGVLGEGGFGQVVAAWDKKHGRRVAIKVVRPTSPSSQLDDDEIRRLVREAKAAGEHSDGLQLKIHVETLRCNRKLTADYNTAL